MDQLLKNDTQETNVRLTTVDESRAFLNFLYPERLILPKGITVATLFQKLKTRGLYNAATNSKQWTRFPKFKNKKVTAEMEFASFLNNMCTAVRVACGLVCLYVVGFFFGLSLKFTDL
jgi:hypothetical protein